MNIVYIFILITLPIVPAIALFKFLKNAGTVRGTGPLGGIKWNLGGAFGGYVLVLLILYPLIYRAITPPPPDIWRVWKIVGQIQTESSDVDLRTVELILRPPSADINYVDGTFTMDLPYPDKPKAGTPTPRLIIFHEGFVPACVELRMIQGTEAKAPKYGQKEIQVNATPDNNTISIVEPIVLKKPPQKAYSDVAVND